MSADHPASVPTRGISLGARALVLAVVTAAAAKFMDATAHQHHGLATAIVVGLASLALLWAGGPPSLARRVRADDEGLTIDRYTRVRTRVAWSELARAEVTGRTLLLVPRDRATFFDDHLELREGADQSGARVPLGRRAGVAEAVAALLPRA